MVGLFSQFANLIIPTPRNNYRAYLLSNKALALYCLLLLLANLFWGNLGIGKAFALFSESEVLSLHNQERVKHGLLPLAYNTTLASSAKAKGEAMLASNCWSHYCPNGKSPWDFFQDAGYSYSYAGENLAEGFSTVDAMMQAWMNSKTHRENILKPEFTEVGFAILVGDYQDQKNNILVVAHFGRPRNTAIPNSSAATTQNNSNPVTLDTPAEGAHLGTKKPEISGSAAEPINLNISPANLKAQISPEGGIFTYQPDADLTEGDNHLTIAEQSKPSDTVLERDFTIDTAKPEIKLKDFNLNGIIDSGFENLYYRLEYKAQEDLLTVIVNSPNDTPVTKLSNEKYTIDLSSTNISQGLDLTIADLAGNQTSTKIPGADLQTLIDDSEQRSLLIPTSGEFTSNQSQLNLLENVLASPVKLVTSIIALLLLVLFIMDFIYIRRYNKKFKLHLVSQSHLHIPTLAILILLIIMGNFTGKV